MKSDISPNDNIIDSHEVEARIEELESLEMPAPELDDAGAPIPDDHDDDREELAALLALRDEAKPYCPDWRHGATLINESHFAEYCMRLVQDIGDLPQGLPGYLVIDWEATADNLRADYPEVEFSGTTFLVC